MHANWNGPPILERKRKEKPKPANYHSRRSVVSAGPIFLNWLSSPTQAGCERSRHLASSRFHQSSCRLWLCIRRICICQDIVHNPLSFLEPTGLQDLLLCGASKVADCCPICSRSCLSRCFLRLFLWTFGKRLIILLRNGLTRPQTRSSLWHRYA